jgi:hypothetical protein
MGVHLKIIARIFPFYLHPLRPSPNLTTCPSSPAAREPISVAISFDLLRLKEAMMQKANVSYSMTKMDKIMRRKELPCVRWGAVLMSPKKKSDEEVKEKQIKGLPEKGTLCSKSEFEIFFAL